MKIVVLITSVLVMCGAAFATSYSVANLNGSYSYQETQPSYDTWLKTFTCPTNPKITYTAVGSTTAQQITYGVATFDGNGNVSSTGTSIGQFNQAASANTMSVTWNSSCQVTNVSTGHIVYKSATTNSSTGTYAVQSDGSGTITVAGSVVQNFQLTATDSTGISNTVLLYSPVVNGTISNAGIAVHQ